MKFSRKTDYGIILIEALRPTFRARAYVPLSEIAREQKLPYEFLQKIAGILRRVGYLEARRGSDGGYRLRKDPRKITLKELIDVFEEPEMMRCMRSPHPEKYCPFVGACPTRAGWLGIEKKVNKIFENVTIASL